jgi:hypothetical protein
MQLKNIRNFEDGNDLYNEILQIRILYLNILLR